MKMAINIVIDDSAIRNMFPEAKKQINRLATKAINDTAREGRKTINKEVRKGYKVKSREVTAQVKITRRAKVRSPFAIINITRKAVPLIRFANKAQKNPAGVIITVRKGKTELVKKAFIATMSSGHTGVYWRGRAKDGGFSRKKSVPRRGGIKNVVSGKFTNKRYRAYLPIDELKGLPVIDMADSRKVRNATTKTILDSYQVFFVQRSFEEGLLK